jgi:hypothetical protein
VLCVSTVVLLCTGAVGVVLIVAFVAGVVCVWVVVLWVVVGGGVLMPVVVWALAAVIPANSKATNTNDFFMLLILNGE